MNISRSGNSRTVVVFSCAHAHPEVSNERFTWLGKFLYDLKPDYVVDLGDGADMQSLNAYDRNRPANIVLQNYERDIDSYNDAQERIRHYFKKYKRKRPTFYGFEGNHETRIKTALANEPRISGSRYGISFDHLNTDQWFDEYHQYSNSAPAIASYDGVSYAHFFTAGSSGRAVGGDYHARRLTQLLHGSATCGHSHLLNFHPTFTGSGRAAMGLVAGCFKGAEEAWAGQSNHNWWKGVVVKRCLEDGRYDPQFISLEAIRREYGV